MQTRSIHFAESCVPDSSINEAQSQSGCGILRKRECCILSVPPEQACADYSTLRRTPASRRAIIQNTTQTLEAEMAKSKTNREEIDMNMINHKAELSETTAAPLFDVVEINNGGIETLISAHRSARDKFFDTVEQYDNPDLSAENEKAAQAAIKTASKSEQTRFCELLAYYPLNEKEARLKRNHILEFGDLEDSHPTEEMMAALIAGLAPSEDNLPMNREATQHKTPRDKAIILYNQLIELEDRFNKLDSAHVGETVTHALETDEMISCSDQLESLRMQLSFVKPTTVEGAAAVLIIGHLFNSFALDEENSRNPQRLSHERAAARCHYAAMRFLATREQLATNSAAAHLDPWLRGETSISV